MNYLIGPLPKAPVGGTHLILSFLEPSTASIPKDGDNAWIKYAVAEFAGLTEEQQASFLSMMRKGGTKVLASVGGAAASHGIYSKYDPVKFGARAAKYAADLGLDGIDIDLEGWGNDPKGFSFLKAATKGAYDYFSALGGNKHYVITHAPEMPDFWHEGLYMKLMADRESFDMIDFLNVQFYNQVPFPSSDHVFVKDIYSVAEDAPTCLTSITQAISKQSSGKVSVEEAEAKLLLGFPCKDGSFPVGGANLNQCGKPQFDLVKYGVQTLHFPLAGVFEWSQDKLPEAAISNWNAKMREAMATNGVNEIFM